MRLVSWDYDSASYLRRILSWVMTLHHIPAALGYDAASYPRRILPTVMMLYHIPEEHRPQPHSCGIFRTQKNRES